jgi:hypothetical protein
MTDSVEFDPAVIDRAIAHLNKVLEMMDGNESHLTELRHGTQPGAAPSTRDFHGLLGRSMTHLREQHDAFRVRVTNQIIELTRTKQSYNTSDAKGAKRFDQIGQQ